MGVHSGRLGAVNGQHTCYDWSVNETSNPAAFVASNTRGGTGRRRGNKDWTGNFSQYTGKPTAMPGDVIAFVGYSSPADDVSGVGERFTGSALIESLQISWDWAGAGIIKSAVNFGGNSPLARASGAAVTDATMPDAPSSIGTKVMIWDGAVETEWEHLLTAQLTLNRPAQAFVNSSTDGWSARRTGNLDWSLAVSQQGDVLDVPFDVGDDVWLRLYIDDTEFWSLKWGHVREFTGFKVDRQSAAIIGFSTNIDMAGDDGPLGALGAIRAPGAGADWWPF